MKRRWITILVILALAMVAYFFSQQNKSIEAEVYEVQLGDLKESISETGEMKSRSQKTVSTNTSGHILQIKKEIGDEIQKDDQLLMLNMEVSDLEIKSLQSKLNGLVPVYNQAKRNATNSKNLYETGAVSYEKYQEALTEEKQLQSQINELTFNIKQLKEMRDYGIISSPITGVVTEVFVKEGDTVQSGSPLIEISDLEDLYIEVDLLTNEANKIKEEAIVDIYSEDLDINLIEGGKVEKIHPKAHTKVSDLGIEQKRVRVDITIDDIQQLKLGYEVDVDITTAYKENILVIPRGSMFEKNQKQYVYVVKDEKAEMRAIETGIKNTEKVEIIKGLEKEEQIILSPNEEIEEGSKIKIINK